MNQVIKRRQSKEERGGEEHKHDGLQTQKSKEKDIMWYELEKN